MTDEQVLIINFLGTSPESWFGKREVARRAVKRRLFEDNPRWAEEPLSDLLMKNLVEENSDGLVRLKKDRVLQQN